MTFGEIIEILRDKMGIKIRDFAFGDFGDSRTGTGNSFIPELGECIEIKQHGGEDQGSEWYSIKYFPDHDIYVKVDGDYSSYEGTEFYNGWACCYEVRPMEKVIIAYQKV